MCWRSKGQNGWLCNHAGAICCVAGGISIYPLRLAGWLAHGSIPNPSFSLSCRPAWVRRGVRPRPLSHSSCYGSKWDQYFISLVRTTRKKEENTLHCSGASNIYGEDSGASAKTSAPHFTLLLRCTGRLHSSLKTRSTETELKLQ